MSEFFDFYGESKDNFYNKFKGVESVLVQGRHWDKAPLVTILLTTYKRCDLLEEALESALNQIGFDDYQIIVVDNEGKDIDVATDTAKLLCKYDNDKVIYYRHKQSVSFKMDNAVKLAKSKWIVFLHDDDVLSPYHLKVLTNIAKRNPVARYLSCPIIDFVNGEMFGGMKQGEKYEYKLYTKNKDSICLGYGPGWLGALINRESYIDTGGMPTYFNNLGDYCMVQKFHYKIGISEVKGSKPLYFRRVWKEQISSSGTQIWTNLNIKQYEYFKYVSKVCHPIAYAFWDRISSYRILDEARGMNQGPYRCNIDLEKLADMSGMSKNSLLRNRQHRLDIVYRLFYEAFIDSFFSHKCDEGEVVL